MAREKDCEETLFEDNIIAKHESALTSLERFL